MTDYSQVVVRTGSTVIYKLLYVDPNKANDKSAFRLNAHGMSYHDLCFSILNPLNDK